MSVLAIILTRLAKAALTLLAIAVLNFCLLHAAPGDPAVVLAGEAGAADEQMIAQLRERFEQKAAARALELENKKNAKGRKGGKKKGKKR